MNLIKRSITLQALAILLCSIVSTSCSDSTHASADVTQDSSLVILTGIPDVRQAEHFSCGAASMQAVLAYYGMDSYEADLRVMLKTAPNHGTYPWDMVAAAKQLGFEAEWKENLTFDDIKTSLQQGIPVITDSQRFRGTDGTFENNWDSGHYMVAIGIDDQYIYLEDPDLLGSRLKMTRSDFEKSWHDYETELPAPPDAKKYYNLGVFIKGTPPAQRPEFVDASTMPPHVPYLANP